MGLKTHFFNGLAKLNKLVLPNYTKKGLELEKATKLQLAIIGWKAWVTKHAGKSNQKLLES
ncbi:SsrA-binding protein [Mesonia aquimarina]|uniref:SsrA-binding protein n=1 Tax=Mesonia aquimarina TaxID=1504967 RepID=UPI001968D2F9|nr:SsrA-binding protein [Mesonia aquimarina]